MLKIFWTCVARFAPVWPLSKQYSLLPVNWRWRFAVGKATVGLARHWLFLTVSSGVAQGTWKGGEHPANGLSMAPLPCVWNQLLESFHHAHSTSKLRTHTLVNILSHINTRYYVTPSLFYSWLKTVWFVNLSQTALIPLRSPLLQRTIASLLIHCY